MKRLMMIVAALLIAMPLTAFAALEGPVALNMENSSVLVAADGTLLTQEGEYEILDTLPFGRFVGYKTNSEGAIVGYLLDETGKTVTDQTFDGLYGQGETILFVQDSLTGVLNADGSERIAAEYTMLTPNGEGGFLALNSDPYDNAADGVYLLDEAGGEMPTGVKVLYGLGTFSEGLMAVTGAEGGRMGYLNAQGEWAIAPQFDYAGEFNGGAAEAAVESGTGVIDAQGNWLVTPKYITLCKSPVSDGPVLAQSDTSEAVLLDSKAYKEIKRVSSDEVYFSAYYDNGVAALFLSDCTQLINARGDVLIECGVSGEFDTSKAMGEHAIVRQGDWGESCVYVYDFSGKRVIGPWQEIWSAGEDENGKKLFGCARFEVTEEVDVDNNWRVLNEVDGTREITIVDEDGQARMEPAHFQQLIPIGKGVFSYETETEAGILELGGKTLCRIEK